MKLHDSDIRDAVPSDKPYKLADGHGLYILVQPSGAKLWRLKYRCRGVERKLSLGQYPATSIDDARRKCDEARAKVAEGQDPVAMKRQAELEAKIAQATTFEAVAEEYIEKMVLEGRGQFLYAASGVIAVNTPEGAWVAPPERAVWIPEGIPHSVHVVGAVQARGVLIDTASCALLPRSCCVVEVSPLLCQLLVAAADIPTEYDEAGRDGWVMQLLITEICAAPLIPIAVPFPRHSGLAALCRAFLERPKATAHIDQWAVALAMNRRSFTRLFRRETGMSLAAWRQQACVAAALPKLAAGQAITTIALDLGYESPANFSTMFKRALGVSPSHYCP